MFWQSSKQQTCVALHADKYRTWLYKRMRGRERDCLCLAQRSEHRSFLRNPKVYAQRLGGRAVGQTEPTLPLNPVRLNSERQANNGENKHSNRLHSQRCSLSPKSPLYDALDFPS
ncbi:hypothetical protein QQF64_011850 [Cirrhinus molitorella]|uniref:Uncharacterized protein n=1 Tax=Cirrhinus molitorella TaxID=172907 RepID=A0ABR3LUY4_9TELE